LTLHSTKHIFLLSVRINVHRENLECLVKQALEETISFMSTATPRECARHQVYVDNPNSKEEYIRVGFVFYYDYVKPVRVSPSIVHESGIAVRRGYYYLQDLSLDSGFVSSMVKEFLELMQIAKESYSDY